jgi:hypothetical protein
LNGEALKQWLHRQRQSRSDFGKKTSNHYLKAMRSFVASIEAQRRT